MPKTKKRKQNSHRHDLPSGWLTSDADAMERRRLRGVHESFRIESQTEEDHFFSDYRIHSDGGEIYRVEIRSLAEPINSCDCPNHRISGLGTCKHIEATTLSHLQHRRLRAFRDAAGKGSTTSKSIWTGGISRFESAGQGGQRHSKTRDLLAPFFSGGDLLAGKPLDTLLTMQRVITATHAALRRRIRVSDELIAWIETLDRREQQLRGPGNAR